MFGKKGNQKMDEKIQKLYEMIEESNNTLVITGAGISLASGGVTYAGMGSRLGGRRAMLSGDPDQMYQAYWQAFLGSMFEQGPTKAHKSLARLEEMGKIQGIITTNVDCMHTMAGSKNVAEIQGSFQVNVCTSCHKVTHGYEIWNHGKMPKCPHCDGMLMPYNMYSHAGLLESELRKAQEWMQHVELILVIGATGCYTHMYWNYGKRGAKVAQINPGKTWFDSVAELNIREGSEPVFEKLMALEEIET